MTNVARRLFTSGAGQWVFAAGLLLLPTLASVAISRGSWIFGALALIVLLVVLVGPFYIDRLRPPFRRSGRGESSPSNS